MVLNVVVWNDQFQVCFFVQQLLFHLQRTLCLSKTVQLYSRCPCYRRNLYYYVCQIKICSILFFFFCLHIIQEHLPWLEACVCRKLQHWCFPVNIAKFFKTLFSQNTSGDCFCLDGHSRYLFLSLDLFILPLPNSQGPWFIFLTIGIKCHVKCCEQCASIQNETNSLTKKTDPGTFLLCLFYRYTLS